jgi:hypothetical protein
LALLTSSAKADRITAGARAEIRVAVVTNLAVLNIANSATVTSGWISSGAMPMLGTPTGRSTSFFESMENVINRQVELGSEEKI